MRFSFYVNPQTRGPEDDRRVIESIAELSREADERGYAAVFLTEHHFTGYNAFSDPFVFGAFLAGQLRRAYIGLSVAVPPLHHPLRFAEQCNLLDQIARGRAIIGVGAGGGPIELAGWGLEPKDRREATEAVVNLALRAWGHRYGEPPLVFETPYFRGRLDGRIVPSSYRKPHPLLARACVSDDSVIKTAGRGWPVLLGRFNPERTGRQLALYREHLLGAGHDAAVVQDCLRWTGMLKMVYVAESDRQAMADIEDAVEHYLRSFRLANSADSVEADAARHEDGSHHHPPSTPAQAREDLLARALIAGSPGTVASRLAEYAAAGVEHVMVWFQWGYLEPTLVRRSFELFTDEVAPRLHSLSSRACEG